MRLCSSSLICVILFQLLQHVEAIAAHMAHGDPRRLGIFVRDLDQFLAALLVQFGNPQAQHLAFGRRASRPRLDARIAFSTACTMRAVPDLHARSGAAPAR